jgi:hypothetical protein
MAAMQNDNKRYEVIRYSESFILSVHFTDCASMKKQEENYEHAF